MLTADAERYALVLLTGATAVVLAVALGGALVRWLTPRRPRRR